MRLGLMRAEAIDLSQRTSWYAFVRLWFLLALILPTTLSLYVFQGWSGQVLRNLGIAAVALGTNGIFYGLTKLSKKNTYHGYLAMTWILLDILLISYLVLANGGVEARGPILYTIPILISAAIFGRRAPYITAAVCALIYDSLITADYLGWIHSIDVLGHSLSSNLPYVFNTACYYPAVLLVVAMVVDFITSMLRDKQLQANESLLALARAQEIAKLGSWEWDIVKDHIAWSEEMFRIFDLQSAPEYMAYDTYEKMLHPDDTKAHRKLVAQAIKRKQDFKSDHRIITPAGKTKYIHSEGRPLVDDHGKVIRISGTSQDITEVYHLDIAKREFVSLASHQLRTPASGVKAFLSLLIDGYAGKLTKKQHDFLIRAFESNNRQLDIIDNLLSLASIESGKLTLNREVIDIHDVINRSLPDHMPKIKEKKLKLTFKERKTPIMVYADPGNLQMAIDNLLSNAIKYTPPRGRITISAHATKKSAYIEVTDTGIGIAKKDLPSLFQKFSRLIDPASKTVGGSGLGLYVARYIVKLHGGSISVHSRHGEGARFTLRLPLWTRKR